MKFRLLVAIAALTVVSSGIFLGSTSAGTFVEPVTGSPSSPQPVGSGALASWDIQVHSRGSGTWFAMDPIAAQHGADCSAPPATHINTSYEGAVFQCKDHVMTSINAEEYGLIYLTPNQMLDLGSAATVSFDISTERMSTRDWWDLWITPWADNLALPFDLGDVDLQGPPRNAIHVSIENGESAPVLTVYRNGQATTYNQGYSTPSTRQGITPGTNESAVRQSFELVVQNGRIAFSRKASSTATALTFFDFAAPVNFSRGIVQFGHHSYTPTKDGAGTPATWHWDNFGINPAIPFTIVKADRRYINAPSQVLTFTQPAPTNAFLRFSGIGAIDVAFDGGPYQPATRAQTAGLPSGFHPEHMSNYWMPIPAGTRSLTLRLGPDTWYAGPFIAKDFAIFATSGGVPTATPTRTATPGSTPPVSPTIGGGSVSLTGSVALEGRPSPMGVQVVASPGGLTAAVAADGTFTLTGLQADAPYTITATLPGFVDARRTAVRVASGTGQLGATLLRAGDVDDDGSVTVTDVSLVAGLFGSAASPGAPTDLTGNGVVDITDVSLVAGNYGLNGPTPW